MSVRDGTIKLVNDTSDKLIYLNKNVHSGRVSNFPKSIDIGETSKVEIESVASKGARGTVRFVSAKHSRLYRLYFDHPFNKGDTTIKISCMPKGIDVSGSIHPEGHHSHSKLTLSGSEVNEAPDLKEITERIHYNFIYNDKDGDAKKWKDKSIDANYRIYKPDITEGAGEWLVKTKFDHIRGNAQDDHAIMDLRIDMATGTLLNLEYEFAYNGYDPIDVSVPNSESNPKAAMAEAAAKIGQEIVDKLGKHDHGGRLGFPTVVEHKAEEIVGFVQKMFPKD